MSRIAIFMALLLITGPQAQAAPRSITEITVTDQLGYACIDPSHLEETDDGTAALAFRLAGKLRLPRTCLPEPCARALTRPELSGITGTPTGTKRFDVEWDEYYARYADFCRKETTPFGTGKPLLDDTAPPPISPSNFWTPVITPPIVTDDIITRLPPAPRPLLMQPRQPRLPVASNPRLPSRDTCTAGFTGSSYWLIRDDGAGQTCRAGGGTAAGANMAPVPLPAPFSLLAGALLALGAFRRRLWRKKV